MSPLAKKMLIKPDTTWLFINAPEDYLPFLEPLPEGVKTVFEHVGQADGLQLFVKNSKELADNLKLVTPVLKSETVFWVTYPKKNSGIETDLAMMSSWDEPARYGLDSVAAISVNDAWTAIRFRPKGRSKVSEGSNDEIKNNPLGEYIDVEKRTVALPPDAMEALAPHPAALDHFNNLSFTNKKEYAVWILTAKQDKTRVARLEKMVELLNNKKKNPSDK